MTITKDVILDLLPLYQANEASADTRRLVEEFIQTDPVLAKLAREASADAAFRAEPVARPETERRAALARTVRLVKRRTFWFGAALASTLMPFSLAFADGRITWFMLRDSPMTALFFAVVAVTSWLVYARVRSQLRVAGI